MKISVADAKNKLPELIKAVEDGEAVTICRRGRSDAQGRLIDDIVGLFGGHGKPVMARLIESGKLSLEDIKEAEQTLRKLSRKSRAE